ncbi:MAG: phage tail protein [Lachnospiraceae bacterium]|nr:phage tail protein [Lachnospiraceae bacterium]
MLRILDKDKAPIKGLRVYKDYCIESVLDLSNKTLSFSAPWRNLRGAVELEGYIETKTDRYVVKEITKNKSEGTAQIVATLDMESLEGKSFRRFESVEQTIEAALRLAFAGTGWTVGESMVTKKRTIRMSNTSALEVLKQALKTYRAEITVNSKDQVISIYEKIGEDKGAYFTSQLNLKTLSVQSTSYDFYTEIEPYGKDGLTIESVNDGKTYVENHQYSNKAKRLIWKDERYTDPESLKEDAEAKLADMSKPYTSYSADVIDLANAAPVVDHDTDGTERARNYSILAYDIGDTVTLIDSYTGTREKQRIVGIKRYPEEPNKNTCTLANKVLSFEELAQKYGDAADAIDNVTNDNGQIDGDAIDELPADKISGLDIEVENAIINSATIGDLTVKYLEVSGKITAVEGEFGTLKANVAEFEEATIGRLDAINATIENLKVTDLTAINAAIDVLQADSANIKSLLAGNAGVGDLQNIHLTSQNSVIDSALIRAAVMQSVTVNDLLAGTISTNKFTIASDDGGIKIVGATQQWTDKDGKIRMQAGRDANGDFTFSLFDASGTGVLIDSTGIKPGAIADGIIVNDMIADNAGIPGSKLDITSVINSINGSTSTINSSRIWFDEKNQSLNQIYSQMSDDLITIGASADNAVQIAQDAMDKLNGISTLDAISAVLDNDAHVVHTEPDGTGGDYGDCNTTITVFSGETDVSDRAFYYATPSPGVTGTWNAATRTYQVTGMASDNGYVDIEAVYGTEDHYLAVNGKRLALPGGSLLVIRSGGARITKRFSISKAPDGRVGVSYSLQCSTLAIRKQLDGTMVPEGVLFSGKYNNGSKILNYAGRYKIEESTDGGSWTQKYLSTSDELQKLYTPSSSDIKMIRGTLYAAGGGQELDSQSIIVLTDADDLPDQISGLQDAIYETNTHVTNLQTSIDGIQGNISDMTTQIHGVTQRVETVEGQASDLQGQINGVQGEVDGVKEQVQGVADNALLYNVRYADNGNGTVTMTAILYQNGQEVTQNYPSWWYTWWKRSEMGSSYVGSGYSITMKTADIGFGTTVIGRFTTFDYRYLLVRGKRLILPGGKALQVHVEN